VTTVTDTNETFQLAADFVNYTNQNIFLTGKAGTGKTTFLKHIRDSSTKNTAIVAPTGVAAINAGGTTIHSFFQLPFGPFLPGNKAGMGNDTVTDAHSLISRLRLSNDRKAVMQALELLIIDEISMVRCDVLDAIDTVLKHVRSQYGKPFGGVQVVVIGDMFQLPPVVKDNEWALLSPYYASPYFFSSQVITQQPLAYIELNKIYRQTDKSFVAVLNQVRNNELDQDGYELLHSRYQQNFNPVKEEGYITLTTHNNIADDINFKNLNQLFGTAYLYEAEIEGEFYEKAYPADAVLHLKIGAQVMFIKNDTEKTKRYYNGKIGTVEKIEDGKIFIQCKDEASTIEVKKEKWKNIRYSLNKSNNQIEEDELGSFTQYPLKLAWAITIHKSQGLTFEKAIIDAGAAFAPGQVYVALSRCTKLQGIVLKSRITAQSLFTDQRILAFTETKKSEIVQQNLLQQAKKQFQQELILGLFNVNAIESKSGTLLNWIKSHANTFGEAAVQSINEWHQQIIQLQAVGVKFFPVLENYFTNILLPEENEALQKRLIGAAQYFIQELGKLKKSIPQLKSITDSKILAKEYYDKAADLFYAISFKLHLMEGCAAGFFTEKFIENKKQYVKPAFTHTTYAANSNYVKNDIVNIELYRQLKKKRDELCAKSDIPVYMVANGNALEEMSQYLPQTIDELKQISGFGKIKAEKVGKHFIEIIGKYCDEHNLHSLINNKPVKQERKIKSTTSQPEKEDTKALTFNLFNEGKTIQEIARQRALAVGTIEGHLLYFVTEGNIDINKLVSESHQQMITQAINKFGKESTKLLKENLAEEISYGAIRFVLATLK
jgi:hypothetical protein